MDTSSITDPLLLQVLATAQRTRAHCVDMLQFLNEHKQASPEPSSEDALALAKHQKTLSALLSLLRGQHRAAVYSVRETKSLTATAKSEIDSLHLQLQNLFYEQRHLRGEIQACEDYPHKYTKLSLVDLDDFLAEWNDFVDADEHQLMIERIKDEHAKRRQLEKQRLALQKKKAELVKQNQKQKDELDKLDKEMEAWLEGRTKIDKLFEERQKKEDAMEGIELTAAS
ncbi:hypothetical protein K461DRAFT_289237 [Myriangium duriaei CBS 260.36]|uniref:Uncharacterized protein n=1 Tax=Myriangium duriaei CBS 260.36 TaxID=1168546 RepID=A0A9P4J7M6_9PEZI|nr:hypothetical protein K461DRAFT_289237 [Myriangium duriaei CBS 260.36]